MEQTKLETVEVTNETVKTAKPKRTKNTEAKSKPRKPRKPKQNVETTTCKEVINKEVPKVTKEEVFPQYPKCEPKVECKCSCDKSKCNLDSIPKWVWWSIGSIMILFLIGSLL